MCLGLYCPAKSFLFNLFCNTNCSGHVATELLSPFRFLISRSFRPFRCWKIWKRIIDLRGRWTVLVNVHFLAVLSNVFLWQFYVQHLFSIYYSSNVWRAESIPVEKHAPWKVQILNRIKPKVTYKHYKLSLLSTSSQKVFANLQHVGISNTICIAGFERSWILIGSQLSRLTPTKDTNWESNSLGVCQIADDVGTFFAIHSSEPTDRRGESVNLMNLNNCHIREAPRSRVKVAHCSVSLSCLYSIVFIILSKSGITDHCWFEAMLLSYVVEKKILPAYASFHLDHVLKI